MKHLMIITIMTAVLFSSFSYEKSQGSGTSGSESETIEIDVPESSIEIESDKQGKSNTVIPQINKNVVPENLLSEIRKIPSSISRKAKNNWSLFSRYISRLLLRGLF